MLKDRPTVWRRRDMFGLCVCVCFYVLGVEVEVGNIFRCSRVRKEEKEEKERRKAEPWFKW